MKRTTKKEFRKANGILSGDWHLRDDQPVCRTDNFYEAIWEKLDFISELQKTHNCPVYLSGDLFEFWKPSPMLLSKAIQHMPNNVCTILGNHDLPQHNLENYYKCGISVLEKAKAVQILPNQCHWGLLPEEVHEGIEIPEYTGRKTLVYHTMTFQGKNPWPDIDAPKGKALLRKYPQYDLILTGHNHKPFVEKLDGRLLVNPGSILRDTASQVDHLPRVYLWYADTNTVEPVFLPIRKGVVSREHIEVKEERDNRIDAFISTLDNEWEADLSFEENLEKSKNVNNINPEVMKIIYKSIET